MLKVFEGQRVENHEKTARLSFAFLFAWSRRGTATGPRQGTRRRGTDDAHGHRARRRDGDIAPYRNGTGPRGAGVVHATGAREGARRVGARGESIKIWVGFLERI